ncbi:901_t:CDS:2 [Ambispora gerdemannii]|uniref:901_t:CDS:1 n=1 Tax=Ambispora gerdemannii TaxID=144530 RepID=A0A9N9FU96_9GLOM|nr:901_t:CDS:2 [Ambispora gerdemannii]
MHKLSAYSKGLNLELELVERLEGVVTLPHRCLGNRKRIVATVSAFPVSDVSALPKRWGIHVDDYDANAHFLLLSISRGPGDGGVDARCETAMLKYAFRCNNDPPSSVSEEQSGALGIIVSAPGNKFTQCAIESVRAFVYPILRTDIARLSFYILNITVDRLQGRPFEFFYLS